MFSSIRFIHSYNVAETLILLETVLQKKEQNRRNTRKFYKMQVTFVYSACTEPRALGTIAHYFAMVRPGAGEDGPLTREQGTSLQI